MLERKDVILDGKKFQLVPLPAIRALKLDKKVVSLILPVLGGVDEFSLDAEINLGAALSALSSSLSNMKEEDFVSLVVDMLSTTIHLPDKGAPIEICSEDDINQIFLGSITTIYKLLWEVMKFNKFSPFVVAGGGFGMIKTLMSEKGGSKATTDGKESEKSES